MRLTRQEIDLLMEGLDAIKSSKSMSNAMGSMLASLCARSDEERAKFKREDDENRKKLEADLNTMEERIILLKAKLIGMKDAEFAKTITDD